MAFQRRLVINGAPAGLGGLHEAERLRGAGNLLTTDAGKRKKYDLSPQNWIVFG
jgi:hypothetical protein